MKTLTKVILFVVFLNPQISSLASIENIERDISIFPQVALTKAVKVTTARVILADYDLIARDNDDLKIHEDETLQAWHLRIDQWLVEKTAYIHENQLAPNAVNTPIQYDKNDSITAYRPNRPDGANTFNPINKMPAGYNRAHVLKIAKTDGSSFLIDSKGNGTWEPLNKPHRNGLSTLGEDLREFAFEKLVSKILQTENQAVTTVGCYAVIDLGFNIIHEDGSQSRAGYILRQAHIRAKGSNSSLEQDQAVKVESILRKYGLTSSGEHYGKRSSGKTLNHDGINIQGTNDQKEIQIIDFGSYVAIDHFKYEVWWGELLPVMIPADSPDAYLVETPFVQPDEQVRVDLSVWGSASSSNIDPKSDQPWITAHRLVEKLVKGEMTVEQVRNTYDYILNTTFKRFDRNSCLKSLIQ